MESLSKLLEAQYIKGVVAGIKMMEQKLLVACENGEAIEIDGRAYFIRNDISNLRSIYEDLEMDL